MKRKMAVGIGAGVLASLVLTVSIRSTNAPESVLHTQTEAELLTETTEIQTESMTELIEKNDTNIYSMDFGDEDAYLLEKIAMAEAEGEDTKGKALVMLVVLNRVWNDEFPSTIHDVIYEEGQFTPVSNGRFDDVEPDEDCHAAMRMITVERWNESCGALYFESNGESSWHAQNLEYLFHHGGHYFYK